MTISLTGIIGAASQFGPEVTDETLAKTVVAGELEAYGELYRRHLATVAGYVTRRTPPQAPREDLVQDAFVEALERIEEYREAQQEGRTFGQWLCGIAGLVMHRSGVQFWCDRRAHEGAVDKLARELRDGPVASPVAVELSAAVRAKVGELRPHYRRAVELHYLEGLTIAQTATVMGRSYDSVGGFLVAALTELRNPGHKRKVDPEATVTRLEAAARQVIAENGVKGATGQAIADAAQVSPAMIYHHFGSCDGLITKVTGRPVKAKRGKGVRNRIVRVARQVIAEAGIEQATARAIARRAGVDPTTIYNHFGSRAALLALASGGQDQQREQVQVAA